MRVSLEVLLFNKVEEFRQEYIEKYVANGDQFYLGGYPVHFYPEDFEHIFSENQVHADGRGFSIRRARNMHLMQLLLNDSVPRKIMFEQESGNVGIFSEELNAVMYIRPIQPRQSFQVMTFFDFGKSHTKMRLKQERKCEELTEDDVKLLFKR